MATSHDIPARVNLGATEVSGDIQITAILSATTVTIDGTDVDFSGAVDLESPIRCESFSADAGTVAYIKKVEEWGPSNLSLLAWYDASDSSTIKVVGGDITEWEDKVGSNDLVAEGTPTISPSTQNGLGLIECDEGDAFEFEGFAVPASGDISLFIVCSVTVVDHQNDSILSLDAASNDFQLQAASPHLPEFTGLIVATGLPSGNTGPAGTLYGVTGTHIWGATFDFAGSEFRVRLDGADWGSTKSYLNALSQTQDLKVFINRGGSEYPVGTIEEIIILENVSDGPRQTIEGYLAWKWGLEDDLSADHPYKHAAPAV